MISKNKVPFATKGRSVGITVYMDDVYPALREVSLSKTDLVITLLAAGAPKKTISLRADCSQALVYKVANLHKDKIAALKAKTGPCGPVPPGPGTVAKAEHNATPALRGPTIPVLDATKPAAVQLEGMAWEVIARAAAGGDVTVKQANAAREIIKQALRDRQPAPTDRKMIFKIDTIDVIEKDFVQTAQSTYEIKC